MGMGIKIQLCAGNGGNSQDSQNSQFHSQKFPNRSNPYISIIPTGNMVGNSLGMGMELGMVGIPKIPKIPKLIPKAFPKKLSIKLRIMDGKTFKALIYLVINQSLKNR